MPPRHYLPGLLLLLSVAHVTHAATIAGTHFTMYQEYSSAPDSVASPTSWANYLENMKAAASSSGFSNTGSPATPEYFEIASGLLPLSHVVRTGPGTSTPTQRRFPSWRGQANPGSVFGPAFANERGSRLHSPLLVVSNGGPFTITSVERTVYSELYVSGGPWQTPAPLTEFSDARIGVTDYGLDGQLGGGDDTYITTGIMSENPILAFMTAGLGFGQVISTQLNGNPWPNTIPDEEIFENYASQWGSLVWDFRTDYKVNYEVASAPFSESLTGGSLDVVPEPSVSIMAFAASLALFRRRRIR